MKILLYLIVLALVVVGVALCRIGTRERDSIFMVGGILSLIDAVFLSFTLHIGYMA